MNNPRLIFALITLTLIMLLAGQWQVRNAPVAATQAQANPDVAAIPGAAAIPGSDPASLPTPIDPTLPSVSSATPVASPVDSSIPAVNAVQPGLMIAVETDKFALQIALDGADIQSAKLKTYSLSLSDKTPVELVHKRAEHWLKTQSGLMASGSELPNHLSRYQAAATEFRMADGQNTLDVPFTWTNAGGVSVSKIYTFTRGSFAIEVRYEINNASATPLNAFAYRQLLQPQPKSASGSFFASPEGLAYVGTALYSPEDRYEKISPDEFTESKSRNFAGGWMALLQHHFFVAWIPQAQEINQYSTVVTPDFTYLTRQQSPLVVVAPNSKHVMSAKLYIGPKLQNDISKLAPGLETVSDYGIFTIFSKPLFSVLSFLHDLTNNWGMAIILIVLLIKLVFYKLSEAQYRSGAKMKAIAPKIEELKRRLGSDPQKFGLAQMELFKKEGVNPFLGCLPVLIQIPIFLGLYWVLAESVEMRQAPFVGWIKDLTAADPYFVLPVLNCIVMFLTSKMTPMTGMDPLQQKILTYMPLMFGVMMAFFPSGLVLYWTFNGMLGLLQQWWITKKIEEQAASKSKARA